MNYLRHGVLRCPEKKTRREELLDEANFYQIHGIITQLKGNLTILSCIIKEERQSSTIMSWLPPGASCTLLFRATTDGKNAVGFHRYKVEVPYSEAIPQSHGPHVSNSFTIKFIIYSLWNTWFSCQYASCCQQKSHYLFIYLLIYCLSIYLF